MKSKITPVRFWRRIFLGVNFVETIVAAGFMRADLATLCTGPMFYGWCAMCVVMSPLMIVWVVGIQIINPWSDPHWQLPTSDSNPLRLGNPLPFVHFASQLGVAIGAGYLLASMWCGWKTFLLGLTCLLVGGGWFLGLRWCIRLAGDKIVPPSNQPT
jgi:hypothetical protein